MFFFQPFFYFLWAFFFVWNNIPILKFLFKNTHEQRPFFHGWNFFDFFWQNDKMLSEIACATKWKLENYLVPADRLCGMKGCQFSIFKKRDLPFLFFFFRALRKKGHFFSHALFLPFFFLAIFFFFFWRAIFFKRIFFLLFFMNPFFLSAVFFLYALQQPFLFFENALQKKKKKGRCFLVALFLPFFFFSWPFIPHSLPAGRKAKWYAVKTD